MKKTKNLAFSYIFGWLLELKIKSNKFLIDYFGYWVTLKIKKHKILTKLKKKFSTWNFFTQKNTLGQIPFLVVHCIAKLNTKFPKTIIILKLLAQSKSRNYFKILPFFIFWWIWHSNNCQSMLVNCFKKFGKISQICTKNTNYSKKYFFTSKF